MKNTLLFACFFLLHTPIFAQQFYIRLDDASGFNTDIYQDSLEAAAERLLAAFPDSTYRDSFKVYDFGFYLHQEVTEGGYPEAFQQMIDQVGEMSPYYLLFGKQTDKTGIYTKFWVALKLPNQDIFHCIDLLSLSLRNDLTAKYGIVANAVHDANGKAYFRYNEAEIKTLDSLRSYITALEECCLVDKQQRRGPSCTSCAFSPSEFGQDLINKGFIVTENQIKLGEITSSGISPDIIGRTNLILKIEGELIEIDKQISGIAERYVLNNPGKTIKVYLNRYDDLCGNFNVIFNQFLNNESSAKIFIVAIQYDFNKIKLYFYYDGELGIDDVNAIEFVKGLPDQYFDIDGNYLGKDEGSWSRIRVINKPLSQVTDLYKNQEKKLIKKAVGEVNSVDFSIHISYVYDNAGDPADMFSKIGGYYAAQFGCFKPVVLSPKTEGNLNALAWVVPGKYDKINVNKAPAAGLSWLDDYNQFTNVLYHEQLHIVTNKGTLDCDHAKDIYLEQMKHLSYAQCSEDYKKGMLGSIGCYLAKCYDDPAEYGGGEVNVTNLIKEVNNINKKFGWNIQLKQDQTGFYCKPFNVKTGAIYTINCIDYEEF